MLQQAFQQHTALYICCKVQQAIQSILAAITRDEQPGPADMDGALLLLTQCVGGAGRRHGGRNRGQVRVRRRVNWGWERGNSPALALLMSYPLAGLDLLSWVHLDLCQLSSWCWSEWNQWGSKRLPLGKGTNVCGKSTSRSPKLPTAYWCGGSSVGLACPLQFLLPILLPTTS